MAWWALSHGTVQLIAVAINSIAWCWNAQAFAWLTNDKVMACIAVFLG